MKWTREQNLFVLAHAHEGAERVRRSMFAEFGVLRSTDAIVRHGNRIGASFTRWEVCPQCGSKTQSLNLVSGLCPRCHWNKLADEKQRLKEDLQRLNVREAKTRYDREQKAAKRESEKFVKMSANMSAALVS